MNLDTSGFIQANHGNLTLKRRVVMAHKEYRKDDKKPMGPPRDGKKKRR